MLKKNISSSLALLTIFFIIFAAGKCFADMAVATQPANYSDNEKIGGANVFPEYARFLCVKYKRLEAGGYHCVNDWKGGTKLKGKNTRVSLMLLS